MKKIKIIITVSIFFFGMNLSAKAQNFDNAFSYMKYIGEEHRIITKNTWSYIKKASHSKRAKSIENKRKKLLESYRTAENKIKKMPDYKGNTILRDSVVSYLRLSYIVMNEDYDKILNMEEVAEQSYDLMEAYLLAKELASKKLNKAEKMIQAQQYKFAEENNITINESQDKVVKNLEIAGKVYEYYNKIYLIFFKSFKQEFYMLDALEKADLNSLEQNNNTLLKYSDEGLKNLTKIKSYKSDMSLNNATKKVLKFYKMEAGQKIPILTDYFMKKEKFEKIEKNFTNKKESKRTEKDIEQYNKVVKEYNNAIKKYNLTNKQLSEKRNNVINSWNKIVTKFIDKNVPRN